MPARWRQAAAAPVSLATTSRLPSTPQHHLIVTHEVTNVGTDRSQLAHVAKETKATLEVEKLDAVADRGYFNSEEILACEERRHHSHTAQADDLKRKGARALRQAGLPLCGAAGRLYLPCRRKARLPLHDRGKRIGPAPLLDQRLPELRHQTQLHHRQGASDHPMGARARSRGRAAPAR